MPLRRSNSFLPALAGLACAFLLTASVAVAQVLSDLPSAPEPQCSPTVQLAQQAAPVPPRTQSGSKEQAGGQAATPPVPASSQNQPEGTETNSQDPGSGDPETLFPHTDSGRYWISGQANVILQWHPTFYAQYSGPNSLTNWAQSATTHVLTLFTGYELTPTTEVFADLEDATGTGIGNANGLAGYSNMDSVRLANGVALSRSPYVARFMLRQIIPLTQEREEADRDELHLATSIPVRRVEFRLGKFDLTDFFDLNTYGSDSHLQFLNWTVDANGAYDYAADTRGYTDGAMVEYDDRWWSARFAEALMPKTANGQFLDADIARARSENLDLEARGDRIAHRQGVVRLLSYLNHGNMGNYEEAIREFLDGVTPTPEIIATRQQGRHKYGFGLNFEQEITPQVSVWAGAMAGTSRSPTPRTIARSNSGPLRRGIYGTVAAIEPVSRPSAMGLWPRIRNILRWVGLASFLGTGASPMVTRRLSRPFTPRICGAASSPLTTSSTLTIRAIIRLAAR